MAKHNKWIRPEPSGRGKGNEVKCRLSTNRDGAKEGWYTTRTTPVFSRTFTRIFELSRARPETSERKISGVKKKNNNNVLQQRQQVVM